MIDLARVRADLPSTIAHAYLNAGTFGPVPRTSAEAQQAEIDLGFRDGRIGGAAFEAWGRLMDEARAAFAVAAGSPPEQIALTHSTTDGCNIAIWALDWQEGDEVVTTTHEHPGLTAPLDELARRRGVVVRAVAPSRAAIGGALGDRTRLVALSHVLWTTGDVLPLAGIAADAHAADALVLVDGAQSGGAIPIDPDGAGADLYTLSGQKWLCGPSGTGALWVGPDVLPRLATPWPWYRSKDRHVDPPEEWTTAERLDGGNPTLSALAGVAAAIEWRSAIGWDAGWERAARLAALLRAGLREVPGVEVAEVAEPGSIVAFSVAGREPAEVTADAEAAGVLVRHIPGFGVVRASVGFWNDEDDLDRLVRVLGG